MRLQSCSGSCASGTMPFQWIEWTPQWIEWIVSHAGHTHMHTCSRTATCGCASPNVVGHLWIVAETLSRLHSTTHSRFSPPKKYLRDYCYDALDSLNAKESSGPRNRIGLLCALPELWGYLYLCKHTLTASQYNSVTLTLAANWGTQRVHSSTSYTQLESLPPLARSGGPDLMNKRAAQKTGLACCLVSS